MKLRVVFDGAFESSGVRTERWSLELKGWFTFFMYFTEFSCSGSKKECLEQITLYATTRGWVLEK